MFDETMFDEPDFLATAQKSPEKILSGLEPPEELTEDQKRAWKKVLEVLAAQAMASLLGPAGTGKTFLITRLVEILMEKGLKVLVVAPTHQAAHQLEKIYDGDSLTVTTIDSALGLVLKPDGRGDYHLVPEGDPSIEKYDLVICDEGSMVGRERWKYIESVSHGSGVKWLFVGDPYQLPPVNEQPSPALRQPGAELTDIVRQAEGNPIIELATQIRNGGTFYPLPEPRTNGEAGIYELRTYRAVGRIADALEQNPTNTRLFAWRNKAVRKWCRRIKNARHDTSERFAEGMHVLAQDAYSPDQFIKFHTSALLKITRAEKTEETLGETGPKVPAWELDLKNKSASTKHSGVLVPRGDTEKAISKYTDKMAEAQDWPEYYAAKEQWASLRYAAATTVHKAQGMTLGTAFVDTEDLAACHDERQALEYVAATRPEKHLVLIR